MSAQRQLEHVSELRATAEEVWARVACMTGVNAELGPWLRMTTPAGVADMRLDQAPRQRCRLRDRLTFTPRLAIMAPLLVRIVDATFRHRHAQLRRSFGGTAGQAA